MFYQNNNDYMRDAFYYSQPQSNTYQYSGMSNYMPMGNMSNPGMRQTVNPFMSSYASQNSVENMYPQVYRIIEPVAKRVIANNSYQYYTEDNLNNMVDTVYNIVEGDVSSLSSTPNQMSGDDTVTQGPARNASQNSSNTRPVSAEPTRPASSMAVQTSNTGNSLLKDLIRIIIIKELLSRSNVGNYNTMASMNTMNTMPQGYYDPRYMGMI